MVDVDDLARRITEGDADALAQYMQVHRPQLLGFIQRRLGPALRSKVEVDDIFQETSADAVRRVSEAAVQPENLFSWLCQIAEQRLIDAHRRFAAQKRAASKEVALDRGGDDGQQGLLQLLVSSITSPSRVLSRNVKQVRMFDALEQLPAEQREALRLRYLENWPTKRIAEQLGKSDAAIRVMLSRSLKRLQQLMGDA